MAMLWRNKALAGQKVTLVSRRLILDPKGFVRDELTPDEVTKAHKLKKAGWAFVDEFGVQVVEETVGELTVALKAESAKLESLAATLDAQRKIVDAISAKIDAVRAAATPVSPPVPVVKDDTPFRKVVKAAESSGISTEGETRDALVGALDAQADAAKDSAPKGGRGAKKDGEK